MIKLVYLLNDAMFPKAFNRHNLGSCMKAAEYALKYFYSKGIYNFKVVEGWVSLYSDQEENDWSKHTWIEFSNGRVFDPTKNQWKEWGFDPDDVKIMKVKKKYSPEEYISLCELTPEIPLQKI